MCHAQALLTFIQTPPTPGRPQVNQSFVTLMDHLEKLFVAASGTLHEVCVQFPEDNKVYKVYLTPTREPSKFSYSCASIYVQDRYLKGWTNFTVVFNTQLQEDPEAYFGTVAASFKLCKDHSGDKLYDDRLRVGDRVAKEAVAVAVSESAVVPEAAAGTAGAEEKHAEAV